MAQNNDPCNVLVRNARASFPHLFSPRSFNNDPDAKAYYSVGLLIPKTAKDALLEIQTAMKVAVERAVATKFGGKAPSPSQLHKPLTDGDAKDPDTDAYLKEGEEFRGVILLNARSPQKPQVINSRKAPAVEEEVWPGQEIHAQVRFAAYSFGGKKGISCYLNAVMLTGRGDRFDGRVNAVDAFAGIEEDYSTANDDWADDELLGTAA